MNRGGRSVGRRRVASCVRARAVPGRIEIEAGRDSAAGPPPSEPDFGFHRQPTSRQSWLPGRRPRADVTSLSPGDVYAPEKRSGMKIQRRTATRV